MNLAEKGEKTSYKCRRGPNGVGSVVRPASGYGASEASVSAIENVCSVCCKGSTTFLSPSPGTP